VEDPKTDRGYPSDGDNWDNVDFEGIDDVSNGGLADRFNMFYVRSIDSIVQFTDDTSGCTVSCVDTIGDVGQVWDRFEAISRQAAEGIVRRMPKKSGTEEGISTDVLKTAWSAVGDELTEVINTSLSEGVCPATWKTSEIRPIPKVAKPKKANQFRPINLLPTFEKVLELVVKNSSMNIWSVITS